MGTGSRHRPSTDAVAPPGPSPVDLHTHTRRSDGVLAPDELLRATAAAGVRVLAITDHDSIAAFRELRAGLPDLAPGLELVSGVEINAATDGIEGLWEGELHILGYGMDPADEAFEDLLARQRAGRRVRFGRAVERLREIGLPIDDPLAAVERPDDDALGRPTLARALVEAGHVTSVEEAFASVLGQGKPGYVPREGIGPIEAIAAITSAGGIAALAHCRDAPDRRGLIDELRAHGLRGLEVHYRRFDEPTVAALDAFAGAMGLLRTGGSDYHGDGETYTQAHARLWVPAGVGETLRATLAGR
jgi:hypothetical protein